MIKVIHTGPLLVNTYIVALEGAFVYIVDPADSSFSDDNGLVVKYLKDNSLIPVCVVLTHGHFDHIAGVSSIKNEFPECKILISSEDSYKIGKEGCCAQEKDLRAVGFTDFLSFVSNIPDADGYLYSDLNLYECLLKAWNNAEKENLKVCENALKEWKIISTPGHTKGSSCLYNEAKKYLISGDTLFYKSYGRTDFADGSDTQMYHSLKLLYETVDQDTLVFPGHDYSGFKVSSTLPSVLYS